MLISAVIPTYKREEKLARAVSSVLAQQVSSADVEVLVVNDSGEALAEAEWQQDERVRVVTTQHGERCFARNTGAALSRGEYLHFLDDDDIILPGAYEVLLENALKTNAAWTYGGFEYVDDSGILLDIVQPTWKGRVFAATVGGPNTPLQASLFKRDAFFESGGFDPKFKGCEDQEFTHRISFGRWTQSVDLVVARIRMGVESSSSLWNMVDHHGRMVREKAFCRIGCLQELRRSLADIKSNSIRGRLVRYYLGSGARRARDGAILIAISRAICAASLAMGGLFSGALWHALIKGNDKPC